MGYLNALLPAGLALAGTLELAQGPRQDPMTELDTDRDGSISRFEASANPELDARFQALDRNANGALEPAEFARFETYGAEPAPGLQAPGFRVPPPLNRIPPPLNRIPPPLGTPPPPTPR